MRAMKRGKGKKKETCSSSQTKVFNAGEKGDTALKRKKVEKTTFKKT